MYKLNTFNRAFDTPIKPKKNRDTFGGAFNVGASSTLDEAQKSPLSFDEMEESLKSQHVVENQKYEQMLRDGPELAKVSKKRRLAAILAGGLAGAANPELGMQVGQMIAGDPQRKADRDYKKNVGNQELLAKSERQRLNDALDTGRTKEELRRFNIEQERLGRGEKREDTKLTDDLLTSALNRENTSDEMKNRGVEFLQSDGKVWAVDKKKGTTTEVGKIGQTPEEKAKLEKDLAKFKSGLDLGTSLAVVKAQGENDKASDEREIAGRTAIANSNNTTKLEVARSRVKANPKIDEQVKGRFDEAFKLIHESGLDPSEILEPDDITGYKVAGSGWGEDSPQVKALKETVRGILAGGKASGNNSDPLGIRKR